ncbi:Tubulin/FtsZ, GTPase domain-containing protein [Mycena vulgaris]|nr:Tubulin/FtsZ, GTPase domain-containing protein [Mycena vulgaris]
MTCGPSTAHLLCMKNTRILRILPKPSVHASSSDIRAEQCQPRAGELYTLEHGLSRWSCRGRIAFRVGQRFVYALLRDWVIDDVKTGPYRSLFHPETMINCKEDAASNYAHGQYTVGKELIDRVMDEMRRISGNCSGLQGLFVFHSFGGGTGSGFGALLLERLSTEYESKLEFCGDPVLELPSSIVEPYNSVLTTHTTLEHSDCSFMAIYDICKKNLGVVSLSFSNLSTLLVQVVSSTAAPAAFCAMLNLIFSQVNPGGTGITSIAFNMALPKLYAVSMLWTLNARRTIRSAAARGARRRATSSLVLTQTETTQHIDVQVRDMFDPALGKDVKRGHAQTQEEERR